MDGKPGHWSLQRLIDTEIRINGDMSGRYVGHADYTCRSQGDPVVYERRIRIDGILSCSSPPPLTSTPPSYTSRVFRYDDKPLWISPPCVCDVDDPFRCEGPGYNGDPLDREDQAPP